MYIPIHGFTVNCMYKDNKRTDSYNRWINNFPNYILKNNFKDIDLNNKEKELLEYTIRLDLSELQKEINDKLNKEE